MELSAEELFSCNIIIYTISKLNSLLVICQNTVLPCVVNDFVISNSIILLYQLGLEMASINLLVSELSVLD